MKKTYDFGCTKKCTIKKFMDVNSYVNSYMKTFFMKSDMNSYMN